MPEATLPTAQDIADDMMSIFREVGVLDKAQEDGGGGDPIVPRFAVKDAGGQPLVLEGEPDEHFAEYEQEGEAEIDGATLPLFVTKAQDSDKGEQIKRAKRHGISIKETGSAAIPKKWKDAGLSSTDFADPVNHRLPVHDADHVRNALARWPNMKDQYSPKERAVIEKRLAAAAKKFGVDAGSIQKKDFAAAAERAVVMGLDLPEDFTDPERPAAYADDPSAWGDFRTYAYPMHTKEAALSSLEAAAAADLDPEDAARILARLSARALAFATGGIQAKAAGDPPPDAGAGDSGDGDPEDAADGGADEETENEDTDDLTEDGRASLIADLGMALAAAYRALSELGRRAGGTGIADPDLSKLKKQFLAGFDAIAGGQADDDIPAGTSPDAATATYEARTLHLKAAAPDLWPAVVTKVGKRHSGRDMSALRKAHDGIVEAGYEDCIPKMRGTQTKAAPDVTRGVQTPEDPPPNDGVMNDDARYAQLDARQRDLEAEVRRLNASEHTRTSELSRVNDALADREEQLDELHARNAALEQRLAERETVLATKDARLGELEERLSRPLPSQVGRSSASDTGTAPTEPPLYVENPTFPHIPTRFP